MMKTSLFLAFIASTALTAGALAQSTSTGTTGSGTTGTTTTPETGTPSATSPAAGDTGGTSGGSGSSSSTGSNTGSGSTTEMGGGVTPGSQSPNPTVHGSSSGSAQGNQGGWGGGNTGGYARGYPGGHAGGFGGQPMLQGMMTCVSPAPMGGFGSFACYPAGWGMGGGMNMEGMSMGGMNMGGMGMGGMGGHHMHHGQWQGDGAYTPNDYYKDRQTYRGKRDRSRVPGAEDGDGSGPYDEDYDNDWPSNTGGSGHDGNGQDDYSNQ